MPIWCYHTGVYVYVVYAYIGCLVPVLSNKFGWTFFILLHRNLFLASLTPIRYFEMYLQKVRLLRRPVIAEVLLK